MRECEIFDTGCTVCHVVTRCDVAMILYSAACFVYSICSIYLSEQSPSEQSIHRSNPIFVYSRYDEPRMLFDHHIQC